MLRINQLKLKTEDSELLLKKKAADVLRISEQDILSWSIVRQSIDARKKPDVYYTYSLDVEVKNEGKILAKFKGKENQVSKSDTVKYCFPMSGTTQIVDRPVIVGMGPAGLFCGYFLALHGFRPILLERGKSVEERQRDVEAFWAGGKLHLNSNVQFGEGGAGTFSDGKLNTLVKDKDGRNRAVLETFVKFGAKESICYEAKPHIGTDVLAQVVRRMREEIIRMGGEVRFESCVTDISLKDGHVAAVMINDKEELKCSQLVLAIGHSARDTFDMLYKKQIPMEAKSFAVGLRVEHPQEMINESQYGKAQPGSLGAAPYKLTAKASNGKGVYSFCMCPGGYVVNASSEEGHTAVNGMSYSGRDGRNANSAIIVSVSPEDFGSDHPLAGIAFQRKIEKKAYELGQGKIPAQWYGEFRALVDGKRGMGEVDFESDRKYTDIIVHNQSAKTIEGESITPQTKGDYTWANVTEILPQACNEAFVDGMEYFGRQIKGFNRPDTCLLGVESRTSSPVRIHRDETFQSEIRGLYPCGEGAGYAGGITSAAMDGLRVAEMIASKFAPVQM